MNKMSTLLFMLLFSFSAWAQNESELLKRIEKLEKEVAELRQVLMELGRSARGTDSFPMDRNPWRLEGRRTSVKDILVTTPIKQPSEAETWPDPSQAQPSTNSRAVRLEAGQGRTFIVPGGARFKLRARIHYPSAAGAAYLLKVTSEGKPLGPLLNKAMEFNYSDGRRFPYCRPDGTYNVFYSPDFLQNNTGANPHFVSTSLGQAYVNEWSVPGSGEVEILVQHGRVHEGQEIAHPLIIEMLEPNVP